MKSIKKEGFWKSEEEQNLLNPIHSSKPFLNKTEIVKKLERLEKLIEERKVLKAQSKAFKGSSICRCCGERNGSEEFYYLNWVWPSGFIHYVKYHNIEPSIEFINEVLNSEIKTY